MSLAASTTVAATANPALDPLTHGWWLASRASGIVALVLITASTLLGLAMATKLLRRPGLAPKLAALHEQLAVTGLVAIGVHGVTLLGDPWLKPGLAGIALPGAIGYRTAFVAVGITSGYLSALLGLSFYARRKIGVRRWRSLHRFTVVAYVLALVHTLGAGTDAGTAWLRLPMLASAALAVGLLAVRILRRPAPRHRPSRPVMPSRPAALPLRQRPTALPHLAPVGEQS